MLKSGSVISCTYFDLKLNCLQCIAKKTTIGLAVTIVSEGTAYQDPSCNIPLAGIRLIPIGLTQIVLDLHLIHTPDSHSPLSHRESYCSVRTGGRPPMVRSNAGSVPMKSTCTPAYRFPSAERGKERGHYRKITDRDFHNVRTKTYVYILFLLYTPQFKYGQSAHSQLLFKCIFLHYVISTFCFHVEMTACFILSPPHVSAPYFWDILRLCTDVFCTW